MGTTEDMLGQEPGVWLRQGWLVSQGSLAGTALAAVAMEGAHRNGNALDDSPGEPMPGNRARQGQRGGRQAAPAAEIKGVDFTQEAPGRSGYPLGCAAGEPSLVIVSLIRSLKEPQQARGVVTSSTDTSCYCGGGESVSLHNPDAFNMPPAR